jgi:exonuclease SbcC
MKPIRLRISGLNSFREVQDIDFSKLCATGVFGIFGSTGSGKSTILDAITLALYGTVERAANNTQGILNHAEDKLTVEYTFSLASGSDRLTYRAERAYRRSGDKTVKASTCRLVKIEGGAETVEASKADEMTKKIEELLGLTVEDFTRAVVLPQGKFAEFLTIKPKDRRQMLERLFSLEAYGRELSNRLTNQMDMAKFNLNGVEQRLMGLGDASTEQVKAVEAELQIANAKAKSLSEDLNMLKKQFEEAQEIWALQEQLREIGDQQKQLADQESQINGLVERLNLAEQAETIRPVLEEVRSFEERCQFARIQAGEAQTKCDSARLDKNAAEENWLKGNQARQESEPRALRQLEQLEQARKLETDLQVRSERLMEVRKKYGDLDRKRKELEQKLQTLINRKSETQKRQQEIRTQQSQITVDPFKRVQVNESAQALETYEVVAKRFVEQQKAYEKNISETKDGALRLEMISEEVQSAQRAAESLKEVLTNRQQNPPLSEEKLSEQAQELERFRHRIDNIERAEREETDEQEQCRQISKERQELQTTLENLKWEQDKISKAIQEGKSVVEKKSAEVKELEQKNLAGLLVVNLLEGQPCPVCGATAHPKPAVSEQEPLLDKARGELDKAAKEMSLLEEKRTACAMALAVAQSQFNSKQESEKNKLDLLETKKQAVINYRKDLPAADRERDLPALKDGSAEQEKLLNKNRLILSQWKQEQEQLSHQLEDAQRKVTEKAEQRHSIEAQIASLKGVGQEIQHRLKALQEESRQRKEHLDRLRGQIALEDIAVLKKQYASWDQTMSTLNQELSGLEAGLRKVDELQQQLVSEKTNLELELQNLKTIGTEAAREVAELKEKWESLTGGKPALDRIEQVKSELALIIGTEEKLKKSYEQAKEEWTRSEQALAVCHKTLELSRDGLEAARGKLDQGLKATQFSSAADALNALCDTSERQKMEQEIRTYHQKVQIQKQKQEDVEEQLKGRSLRPEEWLAWPVRLKNLEKAYTEAFEQRGAAQEKADRLKEKHKEWTELEQERQSLSHRFGLLKTLQTVFKGNAFIEFIAQEQLSTVALNASERLKQLTNQRYALEVDAEGGFIMRDDANGGVRRPVNSLSGGETFLTALALALALSTQIQLRGESPLEFFFLDEGFGTLDANLLETVMSTLEKLHLQNLSIGIISHVPELKNRLARRLIVSPAEAGGAGSKVRLEMA